MSDFDICVIGAGPAGSTCAGLLAGQGLRVALFDRAEFPRDKVCGDGITPRGLRVLQRIGVYDEVLACAQANTGVTMRADALHQFSIAFERTGNGPSDLLVIPRRQLDDILLRHSLKFGPTFFPNTRVIEVVQRSPEVCDVVTESGETITCRLAVMATGAESQILRRSGILAAKPLLEHAARVYFENVISKGNEVTLFFDHVDLPGYGWIFPMQGGMANIGCGVFTEDGPPQGPRLKTLLSTHPVLKEMLRNAAQVGPIQVYPLRTDFDAERAVSGLRLCIGEAAGLVNPITGEGIDYAFESAEFLAQAVRNHWRTDGDLSEVAKAYQKRLRRRFQRRFALYRWIRDNCLSERNAIDFIGSIDQSAALKRIVVDGLFGRARPRDFLHPGILLPTLRLALRQRRTRNRIPSTAVR